MKNLRDTTAHLGDGFDLNILRGFTSEEDLEKIEAGEQEPEIRDEQISPEEFLDPYPEVQQHSANSIYIAPEDNPLVSGFDDLPKDDDYEGVTT